MQMLLLRLDFAALKWDVRFGITLVLCMLIGLTTCTESRASTTTTTTTKKHHENSKSTHSIDDFRSVVSESYYASVNRILRSNDASFRSQGVRWRQVVSRDAMEQRRLYKRDAIEPIPVNSRKSKTISNDPHPKLMSTINNSEILQKNENPNNIIQPDVYRRKNDTINRMIISSPQFLQLYPTKKSSSDSTDPPKNNNKQTSPDNINTNSNLHLPTQLYRVLSQSSNSVSDVKNSSSVYPVVKQEKYSVNMSCQKIDRFHTDNIPANTTNNLDLSCNHFSTADNISFGDLNLKSIDLSHNNIHHIGPELFRHTVNLTHLNLTSNSLSAIYRTDFYALRHLETLRLGHNGLVHVEPDTFADLVNLQLLDLSYNEIDTGAVRALQGIPALRALSVAFNSNLGVALQEFVASWSLKELDASGTGLCSIPAALAQSVHTLNVSHNHFEVSLIGLKISKYLDINLMSVLSYSLVA